MTNRVLNLAIAALLSGLALGGCAKFYLKPKPSILPPYIRKIAIRPFANHTQQYGLEDKLTQAAQTEFNQDGRYQITTEDQADGVVIGDISRYILEPLSYDANHVPTEYKLSIYVHVTFHDKVKNLSLWDEPNMAGELRFFAISSGLAGSLSEVDAQQTIWDQMSRDIATRTFEGFGTVTGASEKSNSRTNPDLYNTLPPGSSSPPPMPAQEPPAPSPTQQPY